MTFASQPPRHFPVPNHSVPAQLLRLAAAAAAARHAAADQLLAQRETKNGKQRWRLTDWARIRRGRSVARSLGGGTNHARGLFRDGVFPRVAVGADL